MKRFFITLLVSLLTVTAFSQIKSIDAKIDYRAGILGPHGDPGIGAGLTFELAENFDLAPRFNYYIVDDGNKFTVEADFHYNFTEINDDFYLYPLVGGGIYHYNWKEVEESHNRNKFLLNLGAGIGYPMNEYFTAFGEIKYQIVAGEKSDTYFSAGISYCF